jgi:uncharacterized protein
MGEKIKLKIKKSLFPFAGKGCFAAQNIKKGTIIQEYKGKILTKKQWNKLKDTSYVWELEDHLYLDAMKFKRNNPLRYVNGCMGECQCISENVEAIEKNHKIFYKAIKPIQKGEELIIDYGDEFFSFSSFATWIKQHKTTFRKSYEKRAIDYLIWCLNYFEDRALTIQFNHWIRTILLIVDTLPRRHKLYPMLSLILRFSIDQASKYIHKIVRKKNMTDIYMYLYASRRYCTAQQKRFETYFKKNKRYSNPHDTVTLNRWIRKNDYRSIQRIIAIYSFIEKLKGSNIKSLPKNQTKLYYNSMKDMYRTPDKKKSKLERTLYLLHNVINKI